MGTGLGSGIVVGGKLVYGHNDGFAGEIGHTIIRRNGSVAVVDMVALRPTALPLV